MKQVDYYLHPSSPWAYLGHRRFVAIARRAGAAIALKPMDLGRIFPVSGGLPLPKRAPQRQAYRLVELRRWSAHLGIALNPQPRHFPVDGALASRAIIAAIHLGGVDRALEFTGRLMEGVWANEQDIADPATIATIAGSCGLDGAGVLANADGAQAEFDRNTQEATDAQVFGAPWFRYDGESFWGQDRLEFVERALAAG